MLAYVESFVESFDPELAMAIAIVVFSMALTFTVNHGATNDEAEESFPSTCTDGKPDLVPESTATHSCSSEATNSDGSVEAKKHELGSDFTTEVSLDNAFVFVEPVKAKKTSSFKKIIKKLKQQHNARKEHRMLQRSRSSVLKKLKSKSFSDHIRSLNPLKSHKLLTRSKSFTVTKSSSIIDDQSLPGSPSENIGDRVTI